MTRPQRAADIRLRAGESGDLATLLDVDLDAGRLFERAGLFLDLPDSHEFAVAERARLRVSLSTGRSTLATDARGHALGFVALGTRDGSPYVEQISVRAELTRRGIGTLLLEQALRSLDAPDATWLTTYDHLPWNRPFYERHGFRRVAEPECGPEIRAELEFQRRWLPLPERRIAMCRAAR